MADLKKAVIIVGPPRSGTSVIANVVSKLGVDFGDSARFVDSAKNTHNPIFFELESLNRLNDEIFAFYSKSWANFDWMPDRKDFSADAVIKFEPKITKFLEEEFHKFDLIGLKDPRFCYTLPLWETILTQSGFTLVYVLVRRQSPSVYLSNKGVNHFSSYVNFQAVAQSNLLAARFVQNKPFATIYYEELCKDPASSIKRICDVTNIPYDRNNSACSVIDAKLHHIEYKAEKPLFKYFSQVIDMEEIGPDEYEKYCEIYVASTHEKNVEIENLNQEIDQFRKMMTAQMAQKEQVVLDLSSKMSQAEKSIRVLKTELDDIQRSKSWKLVSLFRRIYGLITRPINLHAQTLLRFIKLHLYLYSSIRIRGNNPDLTLIKNSGLFDEDWYIAANPDIANKKLIPLLHYLQFGGFEGRDPGPSFCSTWYLTTYPDVREAGVNPLIHYVKYGKDEGRKPKAD